MIPLQYYCLKVRSSADPNGQPGDFNIPLNNQLNLDVKNHFEVGLMTGTLPNNWDTISPALENDEVTINGTTVHVDPGHHTLTTLNAWLVRYIKANVPAAVITEPILAPLYYNGKILLTLPAGVTVSTTLLSASLGNAIGFSASTIVGPQTNEGDKLPDFSGGIQEINVECNLVDSNYSRNNTHQSNALVRVTAPNVLPYTRFPVVDGDCYYLPMSSTTSISNISIKVTDQNRVPIKFPNGHSDFCICVREASKKSPELVPTD